MKHHFAAEGATDSSGRGETLKREIDRTNARLRHFRGIAATVMSSAFQTWKEITENLEDRRACSEILDGTGRTCTHMTPEHWRELLEKLHLLGIQIDYARRLCEGQIGDELRDEGGF